MLAGARQLVTFDVVQTTRQSVNAAALKLCTLTLRGWHKATSPASEAHQIAAKGDVNRFTCALAWIAITPSDGGGSPIHVALVACSRRP